MDEQTLSDKEWLHIEYYRISFHSKNLIEAEKHNRLV